MIFGKFIHGKIKINYMSKKWKEIWFVSAICFIASIIIFKHDPSMSGYLIGAAIMLPAFGWWSENQ